MRFKNLSILLILVLVTNGCSPVNVKIRNKSYDDYKINVEEKPIDTSKQVNVKYHSDGDPISNKTMKSQVGDIPLKGSDKISLTNEKGESVFYTYEELAKMFSERLEFNFQDYRMKETMNYNYSQYSELNLNGIYIQEEVDTVRKSDQYYRDDKRTVGRKSYTRQVEAIKYRNKAENDVIKGTFNTREPKKNVNLEWNQIEFNADSEDIQKFINTKIIDFKNIHTFYRIDDWNNYKAQGTATLRDFLEWTTISNTGTKTLRDDEVEITREVIEKGITTEKKQKVKPLNATFDFTIEVKTDEEGLVTVEVKADLTQALKVYYKIYENYDVINADYSLNIIRYPAVEEGETDEEETNSEEDIISDGIDKSDNS